MSTPNPQQKWRSVDPTAWVDPKSRPARPVRQPAPRTIKGVEDIRQTKEYKTAARRYVNSSCLICHVLFSCFILVWLWEGIGLTVFRFCRWTSAIVGLPIVMYTSWILYERSKFFFFFFFFYMLQRDSCLWVEDVVLTWFSSLVYGNKSAKRLVPLEKKD